MDTKPIVEAARSHAMTLGIFSTTPTHEPKSAPGPGLTLAIWAQDIRPIPARSGLASTSALLTLNERIYSSMMAEPQDEIDPEIIAAVDTLFASYSADFDLGGVVAEVDLLGQYGEPMNARAGYLEQDRRVFRVMTIALPLVINDAWPQSP